MGQEKQKFESMLPMKRHKRDEDRPNKSYPKKRKRLEEPLASYHNELLELEGDETVRCKDCGQTLEDSKPGTISMHSLSCHTNTPKVLKNHTDRQNNHSLTDKIDEAEPTIEI